MFFEHICQALRFVVLKDQTTHEFQVGAIFQHTGETVLFCRSTITICETSTKCLWIQVLHPNLAVLPTECT